MFTIGEDTDLLIIPIHHVKSLDEEYHPIKVLTRSIKFDLVQTTKKLSDEILASILFVHAFLGFDTTSHIKGMGKRKLFKIPYSAWGHYGQ